MYSSTKLMKYSYSPYARTLKAPYISVCINFKHSLSLSPLTIKGPLGHFTIYVGSTNWNTL